MSHVPPYLARAHVENEAAFEQLAQYFARANAGYTIAASVVQGEARWQLAQGVQWTWLVSGHADVQIVGPQAEAHDASARLPLQVGDVIVLPAEHAALVQGVGRFVHITVAHTAIAPTVGVRQLATLPDVSGGCNVGIDAFRRLQITWQNQERTPQRPDGDNLLGCHVLYIAEATSRTHYHPVPSQVGGMDQHELYLILDPADHGFTTSGKRGGVWTYPHPGDWTQYDWTALRPGDVLSIKAGVAHRAVDILACVIAIPGFKPGNDIYIDDRIAAETDGLAPHNPQFVASMVAQQRD